MWPARTGGRAQPCYTGAMIETFVAMSLAFYVTAMVLPGFEVKGASGAAISALIFGALQFLLGKLLFGLIAIATLGVGLLMAAVTRMVVAWLLLMLADKVTDLLKIRDRGTAFVGALAITALSEVMRWVLRAVF